MEVGGGGVGVVMHSLAPGVSDSTANKCSQLRMNLFLVRRVSGEELLCGYVVNGGETGKRGEGGGGGGGTGAARFAKCELVDC